MIHNAEAQKKPYLGLKYIHLPTLHRKTSARHVMQSLGLEEEILFYLPRHTLTKEQSIFVSSDRSDENAVLKECTQ